MTTPWGRSPGRARGASASAAGRADRTARAGARAGPQPPPRARAARPGRRRRPFRRLRPASARRSQAGHSAAPRSRNHSLSPGCPFASKHQLSTTNTTPARSSIPAPPDRRPALWGNWVAWPVCSCTQPSPVSADPSKWPVNRYARPGVARSVGSCSQSGRRQDHHILPLGHVLMERERPGGT